MNFNIPINISKDLKEIIIPIKTYSQAKEIVLKEVIGQTEESLNCSIYCQSYDDEILWFERLTTPNIDFKRNLQSGSLVIDGYNNMIKNAHNSVIKVVKNKPDSEISLTLKFQEVNGGFI